MALNIFEELDLTSSGDNVDEGFLKCKNNWEDIDTELNTARNGETSLFVAMRDLSGDELILDSDGDTSITADTDDQIDFRCGGSDQLSITNGSLVWNSVTRTIALSTLSAASEYEVTGLTAGGVYKISFSLTVSEAASIRLTFNDDTGSNYQWTSHDLGFISSSPNYGEQADNSDTAIDLTNSTFVSYQGFVQFCCVPGDLTSALAISQFMGFTDTNNFHKIDGGGCYNGAANVTQANLTTGAGTLTGTVIIERIG